MPSRMDTGSQSETLCLVCSHLCLVNRRLQAIPDLDLVRLYRGLIYDLVTKLMPELNREGRENQRVCMPVTVASGELYI